MIGKRLADKLFKVWTNDGQECWLLIHIEVQGQPEAGFAERMFVYNYRAYDLYNRPVVSLAVLCDAQPQWRPDRFTYERWGCTMGIVFPVVKLLDYAERGDELEQSTNPFAAIVLAHVKAKTGRATKTSAGDRGALPVLESETFHLPAPVLPAAQKRPIKELLAQRREP